MMPHATNLERDIRIIQSMFHLRDVKKNKNASSAVLKKKNSTLNMKVLSMFLQCMFLLIYSTLYNFLIVIILLDGQEFLVKSKKKT
ncbi:hypothetical protein Lalb_Chr20g0116981 [Lupinus albus]|uniref:Uncharacterized protein n=1 Tax=Lupinus albus TaxID=3870 RepID=A0A6A4NKF0_LUPAL|nr:hypothetical protein Lalb_Chr20g0116981 [Lupinus albus]